MPTLLIALLALSVLAVCFVVAYAQQKQQAAVEELLAAYEAAAQASLAQPYDKALLEAAKRAGAAYYAAILPGAFSLHFHTSYPIDHMVEDFYYDYLSLSQGLVTADLSPIMPPTLRKPA